MVRLTNTFKNKSNKSKMSDIDKIYEKIDKVYNHKFQEYKKNLLVQLNDCSWSKDDKNYRYVSSSIKLFDCKIYLEKVVELINRESHDDTVLSYEIIDQQDKPGDTSFLYEFYMKKKQKDDDHY
jgi:hypothetical protein